MCHNGYPSINDGTDRCFGGGCPGKVAPAYPCFQRTAFSDRQAVRWRECLALVIQIPVPTARNMVDLLGPESELLRQVNIASIGPVTSATLDGLGLPPTVEASASNLEGLVDVIKEYER